MGKNIGEEDLKQLEAEIDAAVEQFFVPKPGENPEGVQAKDLSEEGMAPVQTSSLQGGDPSVLELSEEMEKSFDAINEPLPEIQPSREQDISVAPPPPTQIPASLENLERDLLSLEWEITPENLQKVKREVIALREAFRTETEALSIFMLMEKVVSRMMDHKESIGPPFIKFLMDCKEIIRLFASKEDGEATSRFRRIASEGIEARFYCLEGAQRPSRVEISPEIEKIGEVVWKKIEELSCTMNTYFDKMDANLRKIDEHLANLGQWIRESSDPLVADRSMSKQRISVTVFRIDGRFFGVPSDKVFKLFRLPALYSGRLSKQEKIHLKEMDIKVVDLKDLLSIPGPHEGSDVRILIVHHNEEYKGLMIEQVLDRVSSDAQAPKEYSEYSSAMIQWMYEEQPVEVPVLDLSRV